MQYVILTNDSQVLNIKYTAVKIFKKVRFPFLVHWSGHNLPSEVYTSIH